MTTTTQQTTETAAAAQPTTGPDTLTVVAWRDPLVEHLPGAILTASDDALVWYTPSVGTIGMVMAHRFASYAAEDRSEWPALDIARTFGLGHSAGRVHRILDRLERFGIVQRRGRVVAVRLWLAPLTPWHRRQLPAYLLAAYDQR